MKTLDDSIQFLKGVGPVKKKKLNRLGIDTARNMLEFFPRDYQDLTEILSVSETKIGDNVSTLVTVIDEGRLYYPRKGLSIFKLPVIDNDTLLYLTWFNQNHLKKQFKQGDKIFINGKLKVIGSEIQISSPIWEREGSSKKIGSVVPVYPLTKGLSNNEVSKIIRNLIDSHLFLVEENLPDWTKKKYDLMDKKEAIYNIHFPENMEKKEKAIKRLVFEELLIIQTGLLLIRSKNDAKSEYVVFPEDIEIKDFALKLPYKLTNAQKTTIDEVFQDMESKKQMNRLVQGDVGSGKTIVAILALLKAIRAGHQAAMMVPTEILARQHYEGIIELLDRLEIRDIQIELLSGKISAAKKKSITEAIMNGEIDLIIGTHALIQDNIKFHKLGLVVTDEQHRFGVNQRAIFEAKGISPDVLVMSATPIPRTLSLIIYGDLDISIINELPLGRKSIKTYTIDENMIDRMNNFILNNIKEGRQAYIVCPLIEENEKLDITSAEELFRELKEGFFKNNKMALIHGRLKSAEKETIMEQFKNGDIDILVSTTVIEVGVNVPNASIMVIYNAERFGLSQIHQIRGRVGRGEHQSYCILINKSNSMESKKRMKVIESTNDGFIISEKDLEIRGPGDFFGMRQHGVPEFKLANLFKHMDLLKEVQKTAEKIISEDPMLNNSENYKIKKSIDSLFADKTDKITFN